MNLFLKKKEKKKEKKLSMVMLHACGRPLAQDR
jgi:hypothetical protein